MKHQAFDNPPPGKFEHREITAQGNRRASVRLSDPETLWFNTGTLCNLSLIHI